MSKFKPATRPAPKTTPKAHAGKPLSSYYGLLVAVIAFVLYANTLHHGFALDDRLVYHENTLTMQGFDGIGKLVSHGLMYGYDGSNTHVYRPLPMACFAIEKGISGGNPRASHWVNVLLYALLCWLVYQLVAKLSPNKNLALLVALLFASHPVHTEVVANIKSRDELLSMLFTLLSLFFLIGYPNKNGLQLVALALVAFALALLSKETPLLMVGIVPFFLYLFAWKSWKQTGLITLGYAGVALLFLALRQIILDPAPSSQGVGLFENTLVGAHSLSDFLATNFSIVLTYLKLMLIPYPLSWDYGFQHFNIVGWDNLLAWISLLLYGALFAWMALALTRRRPEGFGLLFFFAMAALTSNFFIRIASTLGERFLFAPSFGLIFALVFFVAEQFSGNKAILRYLKFSVIAILIVFSLLTLARNRDWKDDLTLFEAGLRTTPESAAVQMAIGTEYRKLAENAQDVATAKEYFDKAVSHYSEVARIMPSHEEAYYELGVSYSKSARPAQAKDAYLSCIRLKPDHYKAINNLGAIYFGDQKLDSALYYFKKSESLDSTSAMVIGNIAIVYYNLKDFRNAARYAEKALKTGPTDQTQRMIVQTSARVLKDTALMHKYPSP